MGSRKDFLTALLACSAPLFLAWGSFTGQRPPQPLPQAPPKEKPREDDDAASKFDTKATLEANKKDIKKDVEKLFQLASELKAEVEKNDSVRVLSIAMLKKAEEIEKLAKEIRSRAIG